MLEVRPFQSISPQRYQSDGYIELLQNLHLGGKTCRIVLQCDKSQNYPDKLSIRYFIEADGRQVVNSLSSLPVQILTSSPQQRQYGYFAELKLIKPYPIPILDYSGKRENSSYCNTSCSRALNIAESLHGVPSMLELFFRADTNAAVRIWNYIDKFENKMPSSIISQLAEIGTRFASDAVRFGTAWKNGCATVESKIGKQLSIYEKNLLEAMKIKARSHSFFLSKITVFSERGDHIEHIAKQFPRWHNGFRARVKKADLREGSYSVAQTQEISRPALSLLFSIFEYKLTILSIEEILSIIGVHLSAQQSTHFERGVSRPGSDSLLPSK